MAARPKRRAGLRRRASICSTTPRATPRPPPAWPSTSRSPANAWPSPSRSSASAPWATRSPGTPWRAGHPVTVWNRTRERAQRFVAEHGGRAAETPAQAAAGAGFVFACSGNDDDLRAVLLGPKRFRRHLARRRLRRSHHRVGGSRPRAGRDGPRARLREPRRPGLGGEGRRDGNPHGDGRGSEAAFAKAQPLLAGYSKRALRIGPAGSGQLAKMVNQICIAGLLEALSEGLRFAECAGLDAEAWWRRSHRARLSPGRWTTGPAR